VNIETLEETLATTLKAGALTCCLLFASGHTNAHGDVTPQAVDTSKLEQLGEEWRAENPYSKNADAIRIGDSAFNQNCARCHGLGAVSGGIAPDLRYLEHSPDMDEYYIGRVRHGVTRNGAVYMPPFEGMLSQEAMWAIRAWLETVYDGQ